MYRYPSWNVTFFISFFLISWEMKILDNAGYCYVHIYIYKTLFLFFFKLIKDLTIFLSEIEIVREFTIVKTESVLRIVWKTVCSGIILYWWMYFQAWELELDKRNNNSILYLMMLHTRCNINRHNKFFNHDDFKLDLV